MVELKAPASFEYTPLPGAQLVERGKAADVPFRLSYPSGNKVVGAFSALGALGPCFAFVQLILFASHPLSASSVPILAIPIVMVLLLTWLALVNFLNRTVVELSGGMLTVRSGPLPNPFVRRLKLSSASIYAAAVDHTERHTRAGTIHVYSVSVTADSSIEKLASGFAQEEKAVYVCALLDRHLATLRTPGNA